MYTLELAVFMYRFSISDLTVVFKLYFTKRSEIHDYPIRHVDDLNLTNNKKSSSDNAIRTSGPILWNSLSKTLKESKTNISEIICNKNLFKIMINFDFLACACLVWFKMVSVCFILFL